MEKKEKSFSDVIRELIKEKDYEYEYLLDYFIGDRRICPKPYDDYFTITRFGGCEGIYTSFYVERESDGKHELIATAKNLGDSDADFMKMHELGTKVVLELRKMSI